MEEATNDRLEEVFTAALEQPPERREAFVDARCAGDEAFKQRVESLLEAHGRVAGFLGESGPPAPTGDFPVGGVVGRYRVVRVIATGGMGTVYEAEQDHPHRLVALKILRRGTASPQAMRRFHHETEILGRLHHPGIAQIYDAGTFDEGEGARPYFAMELVQGRSLLEHCDSARLDTRDRLSLFARICDAVQYAHQHGVIHRDLKPDNILVDDDGVPKILDFGVARATDADLQATTARTDVGQLVGTLPYMSPEQVTGDPHGLDTRSDVYALGVVLYELICGHLPYDLRERPIPEAVRAIREEEPRPLSSFDRVFRGDLETIAAKALEKEKDRRYETAAQLAADVRHYLAHEPIVARRASTFYQLRKFVRRNRTLATGVAVAFVALSVGTVAATWQAVRARSAQREAEAVTLWLEEMLTAASPHALKSDVTVRTVLDDASRTIESQFGEQPLVEARLRQTIAKAYVGLGLYEEAELHGTRAYELRSRELGDDHEDTLSSLIALAGICERQGRVGEGEQLARRALALCQSALGESHPTTLDALSELGWACMRQSRFTEAERHLEHVANVYARDLAETNPRETMEAIYSLGVLYGYTSYYRPERKELAEEQYLKALDIGLRVYGPRHPRVLSLLNNLAIMYRGMGRLEEAEEVVMTRVIDVQREVLGPEHPETLVSATNLAEIYRARGRFASAEQAYVELLAPIERAFGSDHSITLTTRHRLGAVYGAQGQYRKAENQYLRVHETAREVLGPLHRTTMLALGKLVELYTFELEGQDRDAELMLREALEGAPEWLQAESGSFEGEALNDIAWWVVRCDRFEPESYELALKVVTQSVALSPDKVDVANTLGVAQYRVGQYGEALATLTECVRRRSPSVGRRPEDWAFIAMANHRLGHHEEARSALRVLQQIMKDSGNDAGRESKAFLRETQALILLD